MILDEVQVGQRIVSQHGDRAVIESIYEVKGVVVIQPEANHPTRPGEPHPSIPVGIDGLLSTWEVVEEDG